MYLTSEVFVCGGGGGGWGYMEVGLLKTPPQIKCCSIYSIFTFSPILISHTVNSPSLLRGSMTAWNTQLINARIEEAYKLNSCWKKFDGIKCNKHIMSLILCLPNNTGHFTSFILYLLQFICALLCVQQLIFKPNKNKGLYIIFHKFPKTQKLPSTR